MTKRRVLSLFVLLLAATYEVSAQDTNYWTDQFGNRARLLGGAVVGSATDLSALYYNPGALALVPKPEVLLAGNVFAYTNIGVEGGENLDAGSSSFRLSPSLFAGELKIGALGGHRLAYSFLTRQDVDNRFSFRRSRGGEEFPAIAGPAFVSGDLRLEQDVSEHWLGVTWAHDVTSRAGLGVTQFLAQRTQNASYRTLIQALGRDDEVAVAVDQRDLRYQHWRLLWKIGLAAELERWKLGLTVTTPSVGLGGSGAAGYDRTVVYQDPGSGESQLATDFQPGVDSDYRSPFSIAFGASYPLRPLGKTRLHFSAEWFDRVEAFRILDTEAFTAQSSGESVPRDLLYALDSVSNVAVGLEHQIGENLKAYGSFRTDFSGASTGAQTVAVTRWDLYHVAGGASFKVGRSDFTAGAVAAFGGSNSPLPPDLLLAEVVDEVQSRFFRLTLILGFNFTFE
jgi:hypothetical protein